MHLWPATCHLLTCFKVPVLFLSNISSSTAFFQCSSSQWPSIFDRKFEIYSPTCSWPSLGTPCFWWSVDIFLSRLGSSFRYPFFHESGLKSCWNFSGSLPPKILGDFRPNSWYEFLHCWGVCSQKCHPFLFWMKKLRARVCLYFMWLVFSPYFLICWWWYLGLLQKNLIMWSERLNASALFFLLGLFHRRFSSADR